MREIATRLRPWKYNPKKRRTGSQPKKVSEPDPVVNHVQFRTALRMDAAKHLRPYQHAKIGEQGKKDKAKERAAELGSSRSRFAPTPIPHSMRVIKDGEDG